MNRLTTLILMAASDIAQSLVGSGHVFAMTNAASHLSPSAAMKEKMSGITQVFVQSIYIPVPISQVIESAEVPLLGPSSCLLALLAVAYCLYCSKKLKWRRIL